VIDVPGEPRYDVCLSFAGEDREYVEEVAGLPRDRGVRVFYDKYERAELWGVDLYEHLDDVYRNAAGYCVMFVSEHYAEKIWTTHERKSAQARALSENREYILPARFDDTPIPGLRGTVGHIDLRDTTPEELAELIEQKIGPRPRADYVPPIPDLLFEALGLKLPEDEEVAEVVDAQLHAFVAALGRMTPDEQQLVTAIFRVGCIAELPENVHAYTDLLRRHTGFTRSKIMRHLGAIRSLGFYSWPRVTDESHHGHETIGGPAELLVLEWHLLVDGRVGGNATLIAHEALKLAEDGLCSECGAKALARRDFSQLASSTARDESHDLSDEVDEEQETASLSATDDDPA
jgi:hypothetical protein